MLPQKKTCQSLEQGRCLQSIKCLQEIFNQLSNGKIYITETSRRLRLQEKVNENELEACRVVKGILGNKTR